ncbi:MAG TPA: M50 family metallopeptidase [Limnochordales bacterium]
MKLGTLFGIGFTVNWWFLLLVLAAAWVGRLTEALTVFAVVLLHELGHVVAAGGCGIRVREVELLPFGGVARMEGLLEAEPGMEAIIALAGPLTNGLLMGIGTLLARHELSDPAWTSFFIEVNAAVAAFNLLPALPLDGGRLYRAYRTRRVGFRRATHQAVLLGRGLGLLLFAAGAAGLYLGHVSATAAVVGGFVFLAAGRETDHAAYVFMAYLNRKRHELEAAGCLAGEALVARADATVKEVVERFVPQRYHVVWIVDESGRVLGLAAEADVLDCLFDRGWDVPVREVARTQFIDNDPGV